MGKLITKNKSQNEILDGVREYGKLRLKLSQQGVFDRSYSYYGGLTILFFVGFFVSSYFLVISKSPLLLILFGIIFSFFTVQLAGLLHDCGHRAIFKSTFMNDILGNIFGTFLGISYNWWKMKHNMHHSHPNQEGEDPDIEIPLISFTQKRLANKKGLAALLRKYQVYLYYPIGSLISFGVRIDSTLFITKYFNKKRVIELTILASGIFVWYALPFLIFPFTKAILLILVINFSMGFYILNVFAPNHKGMPEFAKNVKVSFLEQQIMTARNIYGNFFTDFFYMGLNYQIEHHLFPNTPRNKLKLITPYVIEICKRRNLEFTRTSILESNRIILSQLHQTALAIKK